MYKILLYTFTFLSIYSIQSTAIQYHTLQYSDTNGACTDTTDIDIYNKLDNTQFNSIINTCARNNFGDCDSSTVCIQEQTQLSNICCHCYGNDIECMSNNCMMKCISDDKCNECIDCHTQYCLPALQTCTGITHSQIAIE